MYFWPKKFFFDLKIFFDPNFFFEFFLPETLNLKLNKKIFDPKEFTKIRKMGVLNFEKSLYPPKQTAKKSLYPPKLISKKSLYPPKWTAKKSLYPPNGLRKKVFTNFIGFLFFLGEIFVKLKFKFLKKMFFG